jgi:hypothetical protein
MTDFHTRMLFVALAMLPDDDQPPPARRSLSAGEYRALTLRARRWANICLDAGEIAEARHQLNEAARFSALADEIENERRRAA